MTVGAAGSISRTCGNVTGSPGTRVSFQPPRSTGRSIARLHWTRRGRGVTRPPAQRQRRTVFVYFDNDRACVKTHTSAKCRKHNSPARHRTSLVQYDLTPTDAIAQRYFYVWRDRWSFRTAKTQTV